MEGEWIDHTISSVTSVKRAYTQDVDAFTRNRTSNPFGVYDNKNIMSKNSSQWEELISGVIIVHGVVTNSPFVIGEIVVGGTSGSIGVIDVVGAGDITITVTTGNNFQIGEVITGGTSTAFATVTITNTGSDITFLSNEASVELKCGLLVTDYATRQTHRYYAYLPGKSQSVVQTFVLGAAKANVTQRVGLYDDNNGIFLEQTTTAISLVIRSNTSGSPIDTAIPQSEWNIDKLDGTGKSKITLDLAAKQIFHFDFQWLGSGTVRYDFSIDGVPIEIHHENHANSGDTVYMATPTLPLRYEIFNTGIPASETTMKEICCSISSEGGYSLPGLEFSASRLITPRAVSGTTRTPILAIRLKNTFNGKENRRIGRFLHANFFAQTNNCFFEIGHVHAPFGMFGTGGSPTLATWSDISLGSAVEYSTDITAIVGNPLHIVGDTWVASGQGGKGGGGDEGAEFINLHSFFSQNYDSTNSQIYVIFATSLSGTSNALASFKWVEFE